MESEENQNAAATDFAALNARYASAVAAQQAHLGEEEAAFRRRETKHGLAGFVSGRPENMPLVWLLGWTGRLFGHCVVPFQKTRQFMRRHRLMMLGVCAGAAVVLLGWFARVVLVPQTVTFRYADTSTCVTSPSLFPGLLQGNSSDAFRLSRPAAISIGRLAVFSKQVCARPVKGPVASYTYGSRQSWNFGPVKFHTHIYVRTPRYAVLSLAKQTASQLSALPLLQPLQFRLQTPDATYQYYVVASGKAVLCHANNTSVNCSLAGLDMNYGAAYTISLERRFDGQKIATVLTENIKTITAVAVTASSVAQNATVYDVPQSITLTMSKKLTAVGDVALAYQVDGKQNLIPVTVTYSGATVTVAYKTVLPRQTSFNLHIANVTAADKSQLEKPFDLGFSTSGGPKVIGVSIPSSGVGLNTAITLTFDQALLSSQSAGLSVTLTANGTAMAASYTIHGSALTIIPTTAYPLCAHIAVSLANTVQSDYGISGNSAWNYTARAICYTTFSIGSSVQGRSMTAYQFGSGATQILYIGAMHGNEQNSMRLLQQWIAALNAAPDKIPADHTLVIVPSTNPDGVAANTRVNSHGIDLNRNFPTKDWQTAVTEPDSNGALTADGGPSPLSEPEAQALANYVQTKRPRLILTYHSHAGVVEANDATDSDAIGASYAASSGYRAIPTYAIGNTFDYSTTGAFEDWANQKLGLPALVVELTSSTNDEFSRNQSALWATTKL